MTQEQHETILIEYLAFLFHAYDLLNANVLNEIVAKWNREDIKHTPYGKWLYNRAENFSKIKLKEWD